VRVRIEKERRLRTLRDVCTGKRTVLSLGNEDCERILVQGCVRKGSTGAGFRGGKGEGVTAESFYR